VDADDVLLLELLSTQIALVSHEQKNCVKTMLTDPSRGLLYNEDTPARSSSAKALVGL